MSVQQSLSAFDSSRESDQSDPWHFEDYGATRKTPLPEGERKMLVEDHDGHVIDRRRLPDSGLSVSDLTDWPSHVKDPEDRPEEIAAFREMMAAAQAQEQAAESIDDPKMTHNNKHPSNVHTEFSELNELPENVPICAEKAEIELANRARRRAIQEIGHHSTALRAFTDWCRDFGEPHREPSHEIGVSEFHMGGFSGSGEVSTADKAQALLAWMSNEHPDALEEVRQQYCEWIRDQCRKALEQQKQREKDERFAEHPPEEVNGWERFESEKPDVQVAYRGINHGTPCVATIYRDENGELDAFESTLEWWNEAETAAEANVNRHFVGVNERSVWGHLRRHLNTFDADPIESDTEPENEQTSEDRDVKTRFRGAKNFDVVITIPVDGEHDITDSVTISGSSNADDPSVWNHFSIEGEGPNTHYKFNSEKILDGWDGHERSEVFGESTDDTDSLDPISMDLPEGWELDTHMVGGNVDINGHRETAIFERTDGATVSVEMRNSEYTSNDYEVLSSFIGVPQVNGQLDSDLSKTDAYNLAVDHMADHPPEPDTESEPDAEAAEVATDGGQEPEKCQNCGIEIVDMAGVEELEGEEKIRLRYVEEGGVYCEACAFQAPDFGEYEQTGDQILDSKELETDGGQELIDREQAHPPIDHRDDGKPIVDEEWIGELIFTSWGYGQTNVNAAVIVDVSESGRTVVARMASLERVDGHKSSDSVRPTGEPYGDEFRLRVQDGNQHPWFRGSYPYIDGDADKGTRLDSFMPWGDREHTHQTATGYGH